MSHVAAETDDFIEEFRIRGERDVLLLHGRVDKGCLLGVGLASTTVLAVISVFILFPLVVKQQIYPDALLENQLHTRFANAMAELHEFRRYARFGDGEGFHSAKILVVGVLRELFHDALVRDVANMLQHYKTDHQADRLGHASVVLTVQGGKGTLKGFPIYQIGKFVHWMGGIEHGCQVPKH
ncbi:hypothetical protein HMPREF0653_00104 [Prevotella disiens JCM 6334 = ATCC 29426]|uniref:Uncharacterized protein n=1 Tax=Prevotella disiens JCM 6334 = ATCC 29426 TaxID=1235811 RepID=A0ABN0NVN8_9BACT|nr:hypothetical protein HMPREF0653_00104 [Prevotella disiens JCM 6334 = ATCC 29426]